MTPYEYEVVDITSDISRINLSHDDWYERMHGLLEEMADALDDIGVRIKIVVQYSDDET